MGLGDMAKKWAKDKATELLSADSGKSESAGARADQTEREAKSDASEQLLRAAFPKLGEMADAQEAKQKLAEETRAREELEEIAALPLAQVSLTASGWMSGQWSGPLHYGWNEVAPQAPDPENKDPYATKPLLWFELFAEPGKEADLGGHRLSHWGFQIAGWHGDGTYDLLAIEKEREAAAGPGGDYLEWGADFADAEDMSSYFYPDAGPSTVTVSDGAKRLTVSISTSGAYGALLLAGEITLPS